MVQRVTTVAFEGIEVRPVDVQVQVAPGMPAFTIVGLPDKAVSEARERVRSAMIASGLALPARRITINLAPADLPKEGSHYDLPIALGLMAAIGAIPHDALSGFAVLGELGLDGSIAPVAGVLPAAIGANARGEGLICPAKCGPEAAWASPEIEIIAAASLIQLANHFKGTQVLSRPQPKILEVKGAASDLADIKGQESAKRALEVAAAGGHNLLMVGPPGAGKSMLAARLPSILPPLAPAELLEVSMAQSIAGVIEGGALTNRRPFRAPHHSASMPALVGGGLHARPGEISLAHHGVHFRSTSCRHRPAYRGAGGGCRRDLLLPPPAARKPRGCRTCRRYQRMPRASGYQAARYAGRCGLAASCGSNAAVSGTVLEDVARPDSSGLALLREAADAMRLSARGYHRVLRVARTLADLDGADKVGRVHLAEALSYRALTDEVRRAA